MILSCFLLIIHISLMFGEKPFQPRFPQNSPEPDFQKSEKVIREIAYENAAKSRSQFLVWNPRICLTIRQKNCAPLDF